MIIRNLYSNETTSIRRLARTFGEPVSTVGRWVGSEKGKVTKQRGCPVSGNPAVRAGVRSLCDRARNRTFGYRRIWALLRREGVIINSN